MRHPLFTDEHEVFRASARAFVEAELTPHAVDWEREGHFPVFLQGRTDCLQRHPQRAGVLSIQQTQSG